MELQRINDTKCPDCGCTDIESERSASRHTNGHWNEYRVFHCGHSLHFSPNFMDVRSTGMCTKSTAYKERTDIRQTALDSTIAHVRSVENLDEDFKLEIVDRLQALQYKTRLF